MKLLDRRNIVVNSPLTDKEEIIREVGKRMVESGYVNQSYIEGMLLREESFPTFMGNGLAIPHGVEAVKKDIIHSGIVVMTFPKAVDWSGNEVRIVIGVAGAGAEHLEILSIVAEKMLDEEDALRFANADADTIYQILSEEETK